MYYSFCATAWLLNILELLIFLDRHFAGLVTAAQLSGNPPLAIT